jgi:hypothetical protein
MKMYEILELPKFYESIKDTKLPLKTTYKFTKLLKQAEEELTFYQTRFREIIEAYGVKENGQYKMTADGSSVVIVSGKEDECNKEIYELRNLDIEIPNIKFSIDELSALDVTISELSCLMSLIED